MNIKTRRWNIFGTLSVCMPVLGVLGFIVAAWILDGRMDSTSLLGVFMLPGEVFWIATVIGTAASILSLIRRESMKTLSWCGLIINLIFLPVQKKGRTSALIFNFQSLITEFRYE